METGYSILSMTLLLVFVIDPIGNVPILLAILKDVDKKRHLPIIAREMTFGLIILFTFLFFGKSFLELFHLETESVTIAGGVIFFIIGIRLIFPGSKENSLYPSDGEPFLVPIALPLVAGPSALATLIVMANTYQGHMKDLSLALFLAWFSSTIILVLSPFFYKILKDKGLMALERLMGMLLLIMSVQMFVNGLRGLVPSFH